MNSTTLEPDLLAQIGAYSTRRAYALVSVDSLLMPRMSRASNIVLGLLSRGEALKIASIMTIPL